MQLEELEQIGLTKGEIKVYVALLELGESTKTPIARKSEVSPGKVYDVLERLLRKGLVSTIKMFGEMSEYQAAVDSDTPDTTSGMGPAMNPEKREDVVNSQDDVDDLLSSLGF